MIGDFKIICATWMTNVVQNNYYPVTRASLLSYANTSFVDGILVVDGQSTDDTRKNHKDIPKVDFVEGRPWDTAQLGQIQVEGQLTDLLTHIEKREENAVVLLYCSDVVLTNDFRTEMEDVVKELISCHKDYITVPFAKVVTPRLRTRTYPRRSGFYTYSMIKYTSQRRWKAIANQEEKLIGSPSPKGMQRQMKNPGLSYESWYFTQDDMVRKIRDHFEWDSSMTVDQVVEFIYKRKMSQYGTEIMTRDEHPVEALDLIDNLQECHFGHSMFGHEQGDK